MKSHVLLTTALFLISAPAPDSGDIAEMTSNFIVPENQRGLSASDALLSETRGPGKDRLEAQAAPGETEPAGFQPHS